MRENPEKTSEGCYEVRLDQFKCQKKIYKTIFCETQASLFMCVMSCEADASLVKSQQTPRKQFSLFPVKFVQ